MPQAGLRSIHAKKRKGSTTRAEEHPLAPDLVGGDFAVDAPTPTPSRKPGSRICRAGQIICSSVEVAGCWSPSSANRRSAEPSVTFAKPSLKPARKAAKP